MHKRIINKGRRINSCIVITFLNGSKATHVGSVANVLIEDFEYGADPIVRYKDASLFVGYQRENIHSVVYNKW